VVSRRELLALGSATLLVGCGKDEEPPAPPPAADALLRSLEAERAAAAALRGLDAPPDDRELVEFLASRSDERGQQLAAAIGALTGTSHDPSAPAADVRPDVAVERMRATVAAHVETMPSLRGPQYRRFGAQVVTESAADLALLAAAFGSVPAEAFPGAPT
jgi:hypothetical protein